VDSTAARIMGFNPRKITYLKMAASHLPGLSERSVVHRGENPKRFATTFRCLPQFEKAKL